MDTEFWEHKTPGTVDCRRVSAGRNEPRMKGFVNGFSLILSVSSKEGDTGDACKTT